MGDQTVQGGQRADGARFLPAQLGDRPGSVVALDPRTGAILALWSNPSYDPNLLSNNDTDQARKAKQKFVVLTVERMDEDGKKMTDVEDVPLQ